MRWPSDLWLRRLNRLWLVVIIGCNGYLLLAPFWPSVRFNVRLHLQAPAVIHFEQPSTLANIDRSHNHLVLPTIYFDQPILEGSSPYTVNRGIWRLPQSSTPAEKSNTVLVGHRFTYSGVSVLYLIDKLKPSDEEFVVWDHKIYAYKVNKISVVLPTETSVQDPTDSPTLTIYSCTPMWSTSHRLVVQASLEKVL